MNKALSWTTAPDQTGPGIDRNEGEHYIPPNTRITGTSSSYRFVSYQNTHSGSYPTAANQRTHTCVYVCMFECIT